MGVLDGRTALITGAGRGIGRAIAERYHAEGARVALLDRDPGPVGALAQTLGERSLALATDVRDLAAVEQAVARAVAALGEISIVVNGAARPSARGSVDILDPSEWADMLAVNLTGVFNVSRAALPSLRRAGGGTIIHVASQLGRVGVKDSAAYCATKGALLQLTKVMALDHADEGIRVNSLSPGAILTERLKDVHGTFEAASAALASHHPIGRLGLPEEIAGAAVFLASPDAVFMTGADLVVDGGYTAQ